MLRACNEDEQEAEERKCLGYLLVQGLLPVQYNQETTGYEYPESERPM